MPLGRRIRCWARRVLRAMETVDPVVPWPPVASDICSGHKMPMAVGAERQGVPSSREETAMAVAALAPWAGTLATSVALFRGVEYFIWGRSVLSTGQSRWASTFPSVVLGRSLSADLDDLGPGRAMRSQSTCVISFRAQ